MAIPSIILPKPLLLIQPTASITGIQTVDSPLIFGTAVIVNDLSDWVSVNDTVIFDPEKGQVLRNDDTDYYLIDEQYVYSKEVAL